MRYSLKFKLFCTVGSLILFFIFLSGLLNNLLLEKYYFYSKKNVLYENFKLIDSLYKGEPEGISSQLDQMEHTKGLRIIIQDKNRNVKYDSTPRRFVQRPRTDSRQPADVQNPAESFAEARAKELSSGKVIIDNRYDNRLNSNFISLVSLLNNGDVIFLSTSVAAIQESVKITNRFFVFTGLITIILGSILIFIITKRFTSPILQLNDIAQEMSTMNFSRRYPVKTRDEIGQLGNSINSLSEQLEKSIEELKKANEKLKEDIERERKIDEMRKEFISSVSHELKTPIALIQGYSVGLKVNIARDEKSKNYYCDVISDEALKMNRLVKQLLELAQLESGELHLEKTDFNVVELIDKVIRKNEMIFKEKGIEVSVVKTGEAVVDADYYRIEQILMNYIVNAVNHVDEKKLIKIEVEKRDKKCRIAVFNSGSHIPPNSLDKIWKSFYKVDKARTRAYGGTGLGLSIVRAIQEAHKNEYGVENVEEGVRFWVDLDQAQQYPIVTF